MEDKTLIIGGCGYIGSRLYHFLTENNIAVDSVDLEWFGNPGRVANEKIDFRDIPTRKLASYRNVILLAGHSSVPMCKDDMRSSFHNNVVNFVELIARLSPRQKFIYASSSSVYGNTKDVAAPEDWETFSPKTYYDLNKQEIDYYAKLSDLEYYGLRFGTVNGYSPNLRVDIMLNKMFLCAKTAGTIEVFNKHVFRPILGMHDLCRAVHAIIQGEDRRGLYNLASFNASVEQIAKAIKKTLAPAKIKIEDKGIAPTYNFSINTEKFQQAYQFEFKDSVESIVASLASNWDTMSQTTREGRLYGIF